MTAGMNVIHYDSNRSPTMMQNSGYLINANSIIPLRPFTDGTVIMHIDRVLTKTYPTIN